MLAAVQGRDASNCADRDDPGGDPDQGCAAPPAAWGRPRRIRSRIVGCWGSGLFLGKAGAAFSAKARVGARRRMTGRAGWHAWPPPFATDESMTEHYLADVPCWLQCAEAASDSDPSTTGQAAAWAPGLDSRSARWVERPTATASPAPALRPR